MPSRRVLGAMLCAGILGSAHPFAFPHPDLTTAPPSFPRDAAITHAVPAWSPDDRLVAYMTQPGQPGTLFVVRSAGGEPIRVFADDHHYATPAWSKDGTRLAFASDRGGAWSIWTSAPNGDDARPITPNQFVQVYAPDWSPDGSQIVFSAISPSGPVLMIVPSQGGLPKRLGPGWRPRWSPDGSRIAYTDRYSESGRDYETLALYNIADGTSRRLTSLICDVRTPHLSGDWSPEGRRLVAPRRAGARSELVSIDVASDTASVITSVEGFAYDPAWSHRGDRVAYSSVSSDHVGEIHIVRADVAGGGTPIRPGSPGGPAAIQEPGESGHASSGSGGGPMVLTHQPRGVRARYVEYPSEAGVRIPSWLYEPPDHAAQGPALVWVHGAAPGEGRSDDEFDRSVQYFLQQRYVVLEPNYRGSIGYGDRIAPFPGIDGVVRDIVAAADFLRTLPSVDPARVGIVGFSGGGFWTTTTVASAPSAFRAAVDFFGPTDLLRLHESSPMQRAMLERLTGPLAGHEDAYRQASPISHVDRIAVPVLVVHGDADQVIPMEHSVRYVEALRGAGKTVEFLRLKGGHGFEGGEEAAAFEKMAAFLAVHLRR